MFPHSEIARPMEPVKSFPDHAIKLGNSLSRYLPTGKNLLKAIPAMKLFRCPVPARLRSEQN